MPNKRITVAKLPAAKHEVAGPDLPAPHAESYSPFEAGSGRWLILSDVHLPWHDRKTVELAVGRARRDGVEGVLLNGDLLDCHDLSTHDKDPGAPRYVEEVRVAKEFLGWLRNRLPDARIVLKEGNHEERLGKYLLRNAPALFGLDGVDTPGLVGLADVGGEWVGDRRVVWLGKLPVLHGHEFGPGGGGVNPAQWLNRKAKYVAACGHFHRSNEFGDRDIRGKEQRAWSVGCACYLTPRYCRLNAWNHGFAVAHVDPDGSFEFTNHRVLNGRVV